MKMLSLCFLLFLSTNLCFAQDQGCFPDGNEAVISETHSAGMGVFLEVGILGATYQWYQDGKAINGTRLLDLPFIDTETHEYCVDVTLGDCSTHICKESVYMPTPTVTDLPSFSAPSLATRERLTIAPNPAVNFIELKVSKKLSGINFTITSLEGAEMSTGVLKTEGSRIDVSKWAAGIYLIRYNVGGKPRTSKMQIL